MEFQDTPREVKPIAEHAATYLEGDGYSVSPEKPVDSDAPFRTTIYAKKGQELMLVEAQRNLRYDASIKELALWLDQNRHFARLYIATGDDIDIPGRTLKQLKKDGVGLLMFDENGNSHEVQRARNYALIVPPVPNAALGNLKRRVCRLCERFNGGDRKDALRDLFELVEGETDKLALKAVVKGWLVIDSAKIEKIDWSGKINALASIQQYNAGFSILIDSNLKDDLQSFRGARNLYDHPLKTIQAQNRRELQAQERMIQGPRLLAELLALIRSVR